MIKNPVEESVSELTRLERETQELNNEINLLKGEQGKPQRKANTRQHGNLSSENVYISRIP